MTGFEIMILVEIRKKCFNFMKIVLKGLKEKKREHLGVE
jgi:hypothetical protein